MEIALATVSTKGQIVIPQEMRDCFPAGKKILLVKDGKRVVIKPASELSKQLKEDLEFARRTEEAYKRYERGEFITQSWDDFVKEFKKW